ncbi:DUF5615 family PIN-like protein [Lusitaniella coriacea]|uniref:DUF5615 family PIN-like protein n=1 Tax=Lusitaniella coriacea TaxID=1983105 RepID=UPI001D1482F9|nr:DUF5615 family PIN-like protein [Lusitaniella coriacea]
MSPLRFIADVHISPLIVAALQQQSYDIYRTTDRLASTASDREILELAPVRIESSSRKIWIFLC